MTLREAKLAEIEYTRSQLDLEALAGATYAASLKVGGKYIFIFCIHKLPNDVDRLVATCGRIPMSWDSRRCKHLLKILLSGVEVRRKCYFNAGMISTQSDMIGLSHIYRRLLHVRGLHDATETRR